ncbi:MAG: hypothetical protein HKN26_13805, partial [Acidimicrobiales bacterium]|nr:hypothetical protein [Acidimicrobiales bacterium]
MDEQLDLDEAAQRAMAVALEASAAIGDDECGTEYLLLGIMTRPEGDLAELAEMFALDPMRIERAIHAIRSHRFSLAHDGPGYPPLTPRARRALVTRRPDNSGPTGAFELLHGMMIDDASGACQVLRELGVRPSEFRRLVSYGTRHLSQPELDELLTSLDRRHGQHEPWWGPAPQDAVETMSFGDNAGVEIARSASSVAHVKSLAVSKDGFGITITLQSLRPWLLPPELIPADVLVPGQPLPAPRPEACIIELEFADGTVVDNTVHVPRWDHHRPEQPVLLPVGYRHVKVNLNDRRAANHDLVTSDWWIWPLPAAGPVEVRMRWSAEMLNGSGRFDSTPLLTSAAKMLREATLD